MVFKYFCRLCEREIIPAVKNDNPNDKALTIWETCPTCQKTLDTLAEQALQDDAKFLSLTGPPAA